MSITTRAVFEGLMLASWGQLYGWAGMEHGVEDIVQAGFATLERPKRSQEVSTDGIYASRRPTPLGCLRVSMCPDKPPNHHSLPKRSNMFLD